MTDHYELLQVSRTADIETIHRIYRIMAGRFHPDNPKSGDIEKFLAVERAYRVLSDPLRRADYDGKSESQGRKTQPITEADLMDDGIEMEWSRRLGALSLLYHRCRLDTEHPGMSVLELEQRMGLPMERLTFTLWYLKSKGYLKVGDNSDYALTVAGADYFESKSSIVRMKQLMPSEAAA
jgi:curved DNA-binding protein CbpA